MDPELTEQRVLAVVAQAIADVCDVEAEQLHPDSRIGELGLDSMDAADIIIQTQAALGVDIDVRRIPPDWTHFTLRALALELRQTAAPKAGP